MWRKVRELRAFLILVVVVVSCLIADSLVFRFGIWLLPNEAAWETEPFYNFERSFFFFFSRGESEFRIIIAGSSLGLYGLLPARIENRLTASGIFAGKKIKVSFVAHQGMHDLELAALADRYIALKPDMIVLPCNMVDLRLERPILMGLMADLHGAGRQRALDLLYRDLVGMYGVLPLAGNGLFADYRGYLTLTQVSRIGVARIFEGYRLKGITGEPIYTLYANRASTGRSYDRYAGVDIFSESGERPIAVSHRGWVTSKFSIKATEALAKLGLQIEIPATEAVVTLEARSRSFQTRLRSGWRTIQIPAFVSPGDILSVTISPGVYFETSADTYGARLARNTGLNVPIADMVRPRRHEDDLYATLSDEEYKKSFEKRNLAFERPGWEYLRALYEAKSIWAKESFDEGLPAIQGLNRFRIRMRHASIPLFLVNAPENPLTLTLYERSEYYSGYLRFLENFREDGYRFADARNLMRMQKFYDFHHLTYDGAEDLSDYVSDWIIREFRSQRR